MRVKACGTSFADGAGCRGVIASNRAFEGCVEGERQRRGQTFFPTRHAGLRQDYYNRGQVRWLQHVP